MTTILVAVSLGFAAGILSGMFGVGGGILFVPTLVIVLDQAQVSAQATSLAAMIPVVLVGAYRQHRFGNVSPRAALVVGLASAAGVAGGTVLAESLPIDLTLVRQDFTGAAMGSVYLLMSQQAGLKLVNALVHQSDSDEENFGEDDRTLLIEVGNILINALVGSIANTLGIEFNIGPATCNLGSASSIVGDAQIKDSDYVLFLETVFLLPGKHIGGNLVILLGSTDMGKIIMGLDRIF